MEKYGQLCSPVKSLNKEAFKVIWVDAPLSTELGSGQIPSFNPSASGLCGHLMKFGNVINGQKLKGT
jgi:hypothetical protein